MDHHSFTNRTSRSLSNMKVVILAALLAVALANDAYPAKPAYSAKSYDYPPSPYSFSYAVKDDYYNNYGHSESSDGKVVTGSYSVLLPDGRTQTVTYKADDYGYVADVKYSGDAKYAEYSKPAYQAPAPAYKAAPAPAPYKAPAPAPAPYKAPAPAPAPYKAPAPAPAPAPYKAPAPAPYKAPAPAPAPYKAPAPVPATYKAPAPAPYKPVIPAYKPTAAA